MASRRNVFEPVHETHVDSEPTGRRPSYMDHTKSSLEHIRRDSLEINKSHYSRKSSMEDDSPVEPRNPNSSVKFDVPRKSSSRGADEPRKTSLKGKDEDSDLELEIEEIFDLQRLEKLLETVASYEMRRRIRAQMRLIRKNMINAGTTTTITTITTSTTPGKSSPLPKIRRDQSPAGAAEVKTKEVRTTTSRRQQQQRVEQVDSTTPIAPGKTSPHGKPPVKPRERSASPAQKRRISPPGKQSPGDRSTTTTTKVTTTSTTRGAPSKPAQGPIWADRSKVLKGHATVPQTNGSTPRKGSTSSTTSSSGKITRTMTSSSTTTSSSSTTNTRNKQREEDSITSSYGVGPTDENGLPLFGIRALKKKATPPAEEPCETKQGE